MSLTSTIKYQGEIKPQPPVKAVVGGKITIYYHTLKLMNGHVVSSILGKVKNSSMTIIWFIIRLNSVTFVQ